MNSGRTSHQDAIVDRTLALRRRGDLSIVPVWFRNERWYVAKDPLSLKYTRLRSDEYRVFECLDGTATLRSLQAIYQREFGPHRVSIGRLQALLDRFQELNLLTNAASDQGTILLRAARRERQRRRWAAVSNLLFIKFPGLDPDRLIQHLDRWLGWLFHPWMIITVLVACLATAGLGAMHAEAFAARLPELDALATPASIAAWIAVVCAMKICHELGHALACKHFGGECHQIGPMLMVFTPVLYCDTSDAWLIPHRWQRMLVGAAGVYVELVLATLAAWCWWSTEPGMVNDLALRVLVVGTLGTLLVNANPLLRYDGYFVLADAWGVPNLGEVSQSLWREDARRWFLGIRERTVGSLSLQGMLLRFYAALAYAYRLVLTLGISMLLYRWLAPRGLGAIFGVLWASLLITLLLPPLRSLFLTLASPAARAQLRPIPIGGAGLLACILLALVLWIPISTGVIATGLIEPAALTDVYAVVGGRIAAVHVSPGDIVERGQLMVTLSAPELELAQEQALSRYDLKLMEIQELQARQGSDSAAAEQLPSAREMLLDLENRVRKARDDIGSLEVTAPKAGVVTSPLQREATASTAQLPVWEDSPLDAANRNAQLVPGTTLCGIGTPNRWVAKLLVSETDRPWIEEGQPVRVVCDGRPRDVLLGRVTGMAVRSVQALPARMIRQAVVAVDPHDPDGQAPLEPSYLITVDLEPTNSPLHCGMLVHARIEIAQKSLGTRLWEWLLARVRMV